MKFNDHDLMTAARTIWGEARGESEAGQMAVAYAIRHRAERHWAGELVGKEGAVAKVCVEPYQFSCWNDDDPNKKKMLKLTDKELAPFAAVALGVIDGDPVDTTGGADHYYADGSPRPDWADVYVETARIGHHIFFNSMLKKGAPPAPSFSKNFSYAEMMNSDLARDLRIDNTPDAQSMANLRLFVPLVLQPARDLLGHPVTVTSGYRTAVLNRKAKGALNSDHLIGCAADFVCPGFGSPSAIVAKIAESKIPFKQLIYEHPYGKAGAWVHIGWAPGTPARQVLESPAPGVYTTFEKE